MNVSIPIFKFHIKDWKSSKEKILTEVLSTPSSIPKNVEGERCCTTSYFVKYNKEVYSEFLELILPTFDIMNKYGLNVGDVKHVWYQRYVKGDYHPKHNHDNGCKWSGVFYANYDPEVHKPTVFYTEEPIDLKIVEGDLIIFPGPLYHEVLPCETDIERIIFSFNIS